MRKILLATTILTGFAVAGAAQAATSPLNVTLGGSTDFVAGMFSGSNQGTTGSLSSDHRDFETIYAVNIGVDGKTGNGLQYGGFMSLSNEHDISNNFSGYGNNVNFDQAYIHMSSAFGKLQLGDSHGATDLVVGTPTVGEGQVTGRFIDFLNTSTFAKNFVVGVDGTDHSTNITYFTPKVGNDNNKVQLAVSYVPQFYNYGASIVNYNSGENTKGTTVPGNNTYSPYHDVVKGAANYTGNIGVVNLGASADVISGSGSGNNTAAWIDNAPVGAAQSFTAWGLGVKGGLDGFTLGGGYHDMGNYDAVAGQTKNQHTYTAGLKYEFSKIGVGVSYLGGEGYSNMLTTTGTGSANTYNYIKDYNSYGAGATYSWAPGLTSNLDGVYFNQAADNSVDNKGYVLLVSQKLAF